MDTREATHLEDDIDLALARCDFDRAEALAGRYRARAGGSSLRWRADYLAAQVALAGGRLAQAAQLTPRLLPPPEGTPAPLACRVWLLAAEVLTRRHHHEAARQHLARAREFTEALRDNPRLRLRALRVRLGLGDLADLERDIGECARGLEEAEDTANLALLWCEVGRAYDAAEDLRRAEDCWRRAEHISRPLGPDPVRADVLVQLGRLEHLRGHLQEALDSYDAAQACGPAPPQRPEICLRRALVLLELNQAGRARAEWESAGASLPEEVRGLADMVAALLNDTAAPSLSAEVRAWRALAAGDVEAARRLYEQAQQEPAAPVRRARQALALGLLAVAAGDQAEARRWLGQAEETARQEDLPEVLWRSLQGRGRLAAQWEGDEERARGLFEEAVLIAEGQGRRLRHGADAAAHGLHRADVLGQLLGAACRRGDAPAVFHYQELRRGRLLWELWRSAPRRSGGRGLDDSPALAAVEKEIAAYEAGADPQRPDGRRSPDDDGRRSPDDDGRRSPDDDGRRSPGEERARRYDELLLRRDHLLDDFLRDRSRRSDNALPPLPDLDGLRHSLPDGTAYVAPAFFEDEIYLLCAPRDAGAQVRKVDGSAALLRQQLAGLRTCVGAQLERYRRGFPLGVAEREELDGRLEEMGSGGLGAALGEALRGGRRLAWAPDDELHGLPVHALRRGGRYLIEDHEVAVTFGGALLAHQAAAPPRRRRGRALVLAESPAVLPHALCEGQGVAASFARGCLLDGPRATRAALRHHLPAASAVHFACHAFFDAEHPLAAAVQLPSGETWRALEFLDEPLAGLPLVTLSACRSAEVAPLLGREVFGLVTGLLGGGVRCVVAGLWPVADREALPLMWRFYRHRLSCDLADALARAQRDSLAEPDASPLFWAAFTLFGDGLALPAPSRWWRWWAACRQRRHAIRFPIPKLNP